MEKILVVEDDLTIQKALRRLFESEDYAVEVTRDGKAGLEAFRVSRDKEKSADPRVYLRVQTTFWSRHSIL